MKLSASHHSSFNLCILSGEYSSWIWPITSSTTVYKGRRIRMAFMSQLTDITHGTTLAQPFTSGYKDIPTTTWPRSDHIRSCVDGTTCHGARSRPLHACGRPSSRPSGTTAWTRESMLWIIFWMEKQVSREQIRLRLQTWDKKWLRMTSGSRKSFGSTFHYWRLYLRIFLSSITGSVYIVIKLPTYTDLESWKNHFFVYGYFNEVWNSHIWWRTKTN